MDTSAAARISLGKKGEELACQYLADHGYRIVERNWRRRYGELDIIAVTDNTLVIVEVKTRIGRGYGLPEESVQQRKLREVTKTAQYYKQTHEGLPDLMRIDVIGIELDGQDRVAYFRHIPNVTQ